MLQAGGTFSAVVRYRSSTCTQSTRCAVSLLCIWNSGVTEWKVSLPLAEEQLPILNHLRAHQLRASATVSSPQLPNDQDTKGKPC